MSEKKPTKKPQTDASTIDADGYAERDTTPVEFPDLEWITPEPGLVIEGKLTRAFLVENDEDSKKKWRAAYEVTTADGGVFGFSEKADFRKAIRDCQIGTSFRLSFVRKEKIEVRGKTVPIWRVKFADKADGDGELVLDVLKREHAKREAAGESLPF